jgi:FixJ family two-component response regulator
VFVVDDDASVRKAIGRLMRTSGFEVREFVSPEEFLAAPTEPSPMCVLLDITMPGLTGMEVQEQLNARGSRWPVIAVSAREDDAARDSSRRLGARLFLRKPVDAQALLDAIAWVAGGQGDGKGSE